MNFFWKLVHKLLLTYKQHQQNFIKFWSLFSKIWEGFKQTDDRQTTHHCYHIVTEENCSTTASRDRLKKRQNTPYFKVLSMENVLKQSLKTWYSRRPHQGIHADVITLMSGASNVSSSAPDNSGKNAYGTQTSLDQKPLKRFPSNLAW